MEISKEYDSLRQEALQWQARRFNIVGGSVVGVTGYMGWIVNSPDKWSWDIAAILPILLICASYMIWLCSRFTILIGAYLEVFHESLWQKRNRAFRQEVRVHGLNMAFAFLYFGLGIVSVFILYLVCSKPITIVGLSTFSTIFVVFTFMLYVLAFRSYPRDNYYFHWHKIKEKEDQSQKSEFFA
ncbi:MAG: hypothetical protein AAB354_00090 [candidate division KSB1 bacterium]